MHAGTVRLKKLATRREGRDMAMLALSRNHFAEGASLLHRRHCHFLVSFVFICFGCRGNIAAAPTSDNESTASLSRLHFGSPCTRKEHVYLLEEIGKNCVPRVSRNNLRKLEALETAEPASERPFLRFGNFQNRGNRKLFLLDASPSTYPSGLLPDKKGAVPTFVTFRVVGEHNLVYEPDENLLFPTPP